MEGTKGDDDDYDNDQHDHHDHHDYHDHYSFHDADAHCQLFPFDQRLKFVGKPKIGWHPVFSNIHVLKMKVKS